MYNRPIPKKSWSEFDKNINNLKALKKLVLFLSSILP